MQYDYFVDDPMSTNDFPLVDRNKHLVVCDPLACIPTNYLKELENKYPDHKIECIYFENDAEKCYKNILHRQEQGDTRVINESTLRSLSLLYVIPEDVSPKTIWSKP